MRTYTPKVNRHVTWITASGKKKPATITAVTNSTTVNLRIMHIGTTIAGAVKKSADNQVSRWQNTDPYQNV